MKLKYYLRGLGIGIFVTAVTMGISSGKKQMTDEEIKLRARELGMVESTLLSDVASLTRPEQQEGTLKETEPGEVTPEETEPGEMMPEETEPGDVTPEETEPGEMMPEETEPGDVTPEETEPGEVEPEETEPGEVAPEGTEPEAMPPDEGNTGTVTLTINSGQSSDAVSKLLEEAGLVESATEYDRYLCMNGYDKKIRAGTYEIPAGADAESIARLITRSPATN